ncbi:MAG TPA: DUF4402 domain-containing protein [Sphingomicrobium sp.]|nr:DUF4402 domain-containing protein [Sphingomicrobium sp.]
MTSCLNLHRLLGAALLCAVPTQLHAQSAPVESSASTIILRPATVLKVDDLDFGAVVVTGAGTLVLDPVTGVMTATGGVTPVSGTPQPARFVGAASGNSVVNIKIPKQPVTLTRLLGTETIPLTNLTLDSPDKRTMARRESFEFKVGGTVSLAAAQAEGTYVGTFTVTVQYP